MRFVILLALCGVSVATPGYLNHSPKALRDSQNVAQQDSPHVQPWPRNVTLSSALSTINQLYEPVCFVEYLQDPRRVRRPEILPHQCDALIDSLVEEHDDDADLWLRPGERFYQHRDSCFMVVRGYARFHSDSPYVGATYSDLARMIQKILSVCNKTVPGPRRFKRGGSIKVGKTDEEWSGFTLELQGQPIVVMAPPPRLQLGSGVVNGSSIANGTF